MISLGVILAGLVHVRRWISETFEGERRWRCKTEGKFLIYFISLLFIAIEQAAVAVWISSTDEEAFRNRNYHWSGKYSDDFYLMFVAIMVNTVLNFLMSVYAFYMLEKISRAEWSFERKDCKVAKQTTQMDRAVAGGWFDRKMPIKDY